MKAPINCPVCGDPMLNIFPPAEDYGNKVTKYCTRRIDHKITMIVEDNDVSQMSIDLGNGQEAVWLFILGAVWIQATKFSKDPKSTMVLPWFDPELSNYKRLVEKVKTYLVFS